MIFGWPIIRSTWYLDVSVFYEMMSGRSNSHSARVSVSSTLISMLFFIFPRFLTSTEGTSWIFRGFTSSTCDLANRRTVGNFAELGELNYLRAFPAFWETPDSGKKGGKIFRSLLPALDERTVNYASLPLKIFPMSSGRDAIGKLTSRRAFRNKKRRQKRREECSNSKFWYVRTWSAGGNNHFKSGKRSP